MIHLKVPWFLDLPPTSRIPPPSGFLQEALGIDAELPSQGGWQPRRLAPARKCAAWRGLAAASRRRGRAGAGWGGIRSAGRGERTASRCLGRGPARSGCATGSGSPSAGGRGYRWARATAASRRPARVLRDRPAHDEQLAGGRPVQGQGLARAFESVRAEALETQGRLEQAEELFFASACPVLAHRQARPLISPLGPALKQLPAVRRVRRAGRRRRSGGRGPPLAEQNSPLLFRGFVTALSSRWGWSGRQGTSQSQESLVQPPRRHETVEVLPAATAPGARIAVSGGGHKIGSKSGGDGLGPLPRCAAQAAPA